MHCARSIQAAASAINLNYTFLQNCRGQVAASLI